MDYRKPSKKVIVDAVVGVLKERGSVDTQTKLHRKVVEKLKEEDDMLDQAYEPKKNSRLSCQIQVTDDIDGLEVYLPEKQI